MTACTNCGSTDRCVVSFDVAGGATYTYCRYCEKSSWESEGQRLKTNDVLAVAGSIQPVRGRR